jgi:hypothetical protein
MIVEEPALVFGHLPPGLGSGGGGTAVDGTTATTGAILAVFRPFFVLVLAR